VLLDQVDGFESVLARATTFTYGKTLDEEGEFVPRQLFVIDDDRGKWP